MSRLAAQAKALKREKEVTEPRRKEAFWRLNAARPRWGCFFRAGSLRWQRFRIVRYHREPGGENACDCMALARRAICDDPRRGPDGAFGSATAIMSEDADQKHTGRIGNRTERLRSGTLVTP
jgi:hypothetical protein